MSEGHNDVLQAAVSSSYAAASDAGPTMVEGKLPQAARPILSHHIPSTYLLKNPSALAYSVANKHRGAFRQKCSTEKALFVWMTFHSRKLPNCVSDPASRLQPNNHNFSSFR